ncbi:MAG: TonB-dependent receptor [Pseudomonadota bacterium]|nr:TonB-dependent receptor [Pseudomonadota bacterium]
MRRSLWMRGSASLIALAALTSVAHAQDASSPTTGPIPQEEDPNTVDEIVVTAQRREQSLQDVPVVVSAFSEQTLEDAGVRDIRDLQILTPGLVVTSTTSEVVTTARIRGVGTVGDNPGLESSVGVTIDGVYRPRNGVGFNDLGQISRIEVLKGPQGTLFGRNTSAGVINVITEAPRFQFETEGELTVGNYGQRGIAGSVTGPLDERGFAAGRLYAARRVRDGFYDVRTGEGPRTETEDQNQDFYTVRGQLLFNLNAGTSLRLIADFTDRDEDCCVAVQVRVGPTGRLVDALATDQGLRNPPQPFDRVAFSNRGTDQRIQDAGISAELNTDFTLFGEEATFTSLTAFRHWDSENGQDSDFTSADLLYRPADGTFAQTFATLTQELRLTGTAGRVDYLVGGFFVSEDLTRNDRFLAGADYETYISLLLSGGTNPRQVSQLTGLPPGQSFPSGTGFLDRYSQDTRSFALFTHNIIGLTDQLDLTLGLRYTTEEKSLFSRFTNSDNARACAAVQARAPFLPPAARGAIPVLCLPFFNNNFNNRQTTQNREENELTGTAKLSFRPNDDLLLYLSYARGYKAGGFNLDRSISANGLPTGGPGLLAVADTSFPAEFVDSYEAGAKSTLLNGQLLLNATAFHQIFEDFQLNTFLGTTFVVESIPEVTSTGVDADFIYLTPVDGLSFQGGLTYAQTEYSEFTPADLSNPARFQQLQLLPGNRLSFAPEFSGTASASYEREFGRLMARFFLGAKYTSEYNTGSDLLPFKIQEGFTLVNGRVGLGTLDDRIRVELFAMNLTDEDYYQVVFNQPLQGSAFPASGPYNPATDTQTYGAFLGQPRTYGVTLRLQY